MNPKAYRLPTSVLPRQYDITLQAWLGGKEFEGRVAIQLEVVAPTSVIELHARDLRVTEAVLTLQDQTLPGAVTLDADREIVIAQFAEPLPAGPATLALTFAGKVTNSREGLFLSKDGPDELLCTHCEPTGARAIFPCFDEPTFKARFAWQVTTGPDAGVLTNGRLISTTANTDGGAKTWTFAPTRPMSSYLIAMTLGNLASTPERVVNGIPLGIWAPRGKEHLGQFALDYTARLLPFYEDYFAAPYHFEKLDQVGIPSFFGGAMENAGLIVSDQVALLLDQQSASLQQEMLVAGVVAHEFAHMWFGDLVTMKWWDDLWLNEAFASWMAFHAVDTLSPQYHVWDEVQLGFDRALDTDALTGTHPIYNVVETPRSILENFDEITYQKGGAVLRMVHDFLGDDAFRAGLRTYMAEFAENNATGADLWRHLQQASRLPVGQMMENWVLQPGHPLIEVGLSGSGAETRLHLSQRRFFSSPQPPASDQLWQVPLVIRYEDSAGVHASRFLLSERSASIPLSVTGDLRWCYANAGEVGFYRLLPDAALLERQLAHLDRLTAAERKGLLRDQWALVGNASQPIAAYLDVLGAVAHSDDQTLVHQIVVDHLPRVETLLEAAGDERATAGFRAWVDGLFRKQMAALGFEPRPGESNDEAQLRAHVLSAMTRYAYDPQAIAQARMWQEREAADPALVDPNLAPVFVGATAQFGDASTYERYLGIYQQRQAGGYTPQQVERYAGAFARFEQPELVMRTLKLMAEDFFPFHSLGQLLATLLVQSRTQAAAWEWVKEHWAFIQERAPMFVPFIVQFSGNLPASLRSDVAAFWDTHLQGEFAGPYARALEQIDQNADLQARTKDGLIAYFDPLGPAVGTGEAAPTSSPPTPPTSPSAAPSSGPSPDHAPDASASVAAAPAAGPPTAAPAAHAGAAAEPQPARGLWGWLRGLFGSRR
jgi:puromycin-sensitive aminopeptidase